MSARSCVLLRQVTPKRDKDRAVTVEYAAMENWPVNLIGLGLIIAGVLFMYFLSVVGFVIGLPMVSAESSRSS